MDFEKVHLLYANYYESGFICEKCTYRNNHRNGVYLSYRPNETFLERTIHKNGDKTFGRSTVKSIQNPDKSADKLAFLSTAERAQALEVENNILRQRIVDLEYRLNFLSANQQFQRT